MMEKRGGARAGSFIAAAQSQKRLLTFPPGNPTMKERHSRTLGIYFLIHFKSLSALSTKYPHVLAHIEMQNLFPRII